MENTEQIHGPRTTEQSKEEGRLKVDAGFSKKKKGIIKKVISSKMKKC